MPQLYQLITHTVMAMQLTPDRVLDAEMWTKGMQTESIDPFDGSKRFVELNIPTLKGVIRASQGDWIVKRDGEDFTKMSDQEFRNTYQKV